MSARRTPIICRAAAAPAGHRTTCQLKGHLPLVVAAGLRAGNGQFANCMPRDPLSANVPCMLRKVNVTRIYPFILHA